MFSLEKNINEVEDIINGYNKNYEIIEVNKGINNNIKENINEKKKLEKNITELSEKLGEIIQENCHIQEIIDEYKDNNIIFKDKENELKQLQILEGALGRDGIPLLMLEKYNKFLYYIIVVNFIYSMLSFLVFILFAVFLSLN